MPLAPEAISRIDALIAALGADASVRSFGIALRRLLPEVACRQCDASDVLEEPFRAVGAVDLHLLDARGHCIRVVDDPAEATALLIAAKVAA